MVGVDFTNKYCYRNIQFIAIRRKVVIEQIWHSVFMFALDMPPQSASHLYITSQGVAFVTATSTCASTDHLTYLLSAGYTRNK